MKNSMHFVAVSAFLLVVLSLGAGAQPGISGKIITETAVPIANASILLVNASDTSLVLGTTSNVSGDFLFTQVKTGRYRLICSHLGYQDYYHAPFDFAQQPVSIVPIRLAPIPQELQGVAVTATRPLFEQKIDRMVVNVKNSITNAGGTVLDVLEKSPGVIVNRSAGAISMNGKDGVMVMINGKINYMPAEALVQMLDGINSSNVDKIELLTVPPAKYDAGGNAGYINIVLIDNPNEGFNGNYSASMGVGKGTFPTAALNLNYRKNKINLYGTYGFSREAQLQTFKNYRQVTYKGIRNESRIVSDRDPAQRNHNARLGLDYNLSKKTMVGVLIAGYDNRWSMDAVNRSTSFRNGVPDTTIVIDNDEINYWKHAMGNVNLQHKVSDGEQFSFNADYLYYHNRNPTNYHNTYLDGGGQKLFEENTTSGKVTIIKVFVSQLDYSKKLSDEFSMEAGIKGTFSRFTNDILVQRQVQNVWVPDPKFTGIYFLREDIAAGYISVEGKLGEKTSVKAGLRYEHTISNLDSKIQKDIVDRKYGSLFPTFYISRKLTDVNTINFSYNRRINRPAFTQLAPFLIFFDPKTFISGNSALQPGITDAVKVDFTARKLIFSLSLSNENNAISRFQTEVDSVANTQTQTSQNLDFLKQVFASASLPIKITSWWSSQVNVSLNWNKVRAIIGKEPVTVSQYFFTINGAESFTLPKNFSIELSGFFRSKSLVWGANVIQPFGSMNVAVQKKFQDGNSSLTLGVDNVFNSLILKSSLAVKEQNFIQEGSYQFAQRTFKLSWSQNFGNKALKAKRDRGTASDDIRRRVE